MSNAQGKLVGSQAPQPAASSAQAGFSGAPGSDPVDMTDDPEYQAWTESMAQHCRCSHDCPCAGVLAGGLCDGLTDDDCDCLFDSEDEV